MAFDLFSGGSSSNQATTAATGGSQVAQSKGIITNPNSFAVGAGGTYVSPGATTFKNFKGDLTITAPASPDLSGYFSALSNLSGNPTGTTTNPADTTVNQTPAATDATATQSWVDKIAAKLGVTKNQVLGGLAVIAGLVLWKLFFRGGSR